MKILVLNGSPKRNKSNTMIITNKFLEGMGNNHDVDIFNVYELEINKCTGCYTCWSKTPGKCVFDDDMNKIKEKMIDADLIVWSFPIYHFSMPSGLKAVVERTLPFVHSDIIINEDNTATHPSRINFKGQKNILISNSGFPSLKNNYEAILAQFDIGHKDGYEKIICIQGELLSRPELNNKTSTYLDAVKKAGEEYNANGSISEETKLILSKPILPIETYTKMAELSWKIKSGNEDGEVASEVFIRQMALVYNKEAYEKDIILEMSFTDLNKRYQLHIKPDECNVLTDNLKKYDTKIETSFDIWQKISKGEIDGATAMMKKMYKVSGDFNTMLKLDELFGPGAEGDSLKKKPKLNDDAIKESKDTSEVFMQQMALSYNKKLYEKDIVLEMCFTDLNKSYQLHIKSDACHVVKDNFKKFDTKIETPFDVWEKISKGEIDGVTAMMKKMYKMSGDFDTMLKIDDLFGEVEEESYEEINSKKTNMSMLLLPFMLPNIGLSFNAKIGAAVSVATIFLILMLSSKYKSTIFDKLSLVLFPAVGIASLLIPSYNKELINVIFFVFGTMWLTSGFFKIPLTAYYTSGNHGGSKMLNNPLFIKTNRILTILWGIIYILNSVLSYVLSYTVLSSYDVWIIQGIFFIGGMFTVWFQKWYPEKVAKGEI